MTPPRRVQRTVPMVAGVVGLIAIALLVMLANASPSDGETASSPLLGRAAPAVKSTTLDGDSFDISRRRGSWVMLNFSIPHAFRAFKSMVLLPTLLQHKQLSLMQWNSSQLSMTIMTMPFAPFSRPTEETGQKSRTLMARSPLLLVSLKFLKHGSSTPMVLCACELLVESRQVFLKIESPNCANNLRAHHDDVSS